MRCLLKRWCGLPEEQPVPDVKLVHFLFTREVNIQGSVKLLARLLTALLPSLLVKLRVLLDTSKELLTALGMSDVLNTDVNTLFDIAVADDLVDNDTDSGGGDVVDDASSPVIHHVNPPKIKIPHCKTHPW